MFFLNCGIQVNVLGRWYGCIHPLLKGSVIHLCPLRPLPCPAAGVFCAIVSHPADTVVSVLNKESGSTAIQVLKKLGPKGE